MKKQTEILFRIQFTIELHAIELRERFLNGGSMSVEAEEEGGGEKENTVHNAEKERLRDMPTNKSLESRTSGLALASGNSYASMGASTYGAHYGIASVKGWA